MLVNAFIITNTSGSLDVLVYAFIITNTTSIWELKPLSEYTNGQALKRKTNVGSVISTEYKLTLRALKMLAGIVSSASYKVKI